ncbi:MAG TPA: class I adenylate-forming enzyme family protein [Beijerinckiaceae bacterium]|jgi:long-chain acyl-CoA synthetase|nr:class I adenylate-forming enzyme family protein [Beijerinckiaceae bacterium]
MSEPSAKLWPVMCLAEADALLNRPGSPLEWEEIDIRGVKTRVWKNAPPTLRDIFLRGRASFAERTFLVYQDERTTFEGFARAALTIAHRLTQEGVRKGDRVVIAMRNLPEWPAAFYGAILAGAIATPLNAWWTGPELEYALQDSGAKVAFLDSERLERLSEHLHNLPELSRVFVCRSAEPIAHPHVTKLESIIGPVNSWADLPDYAVPDVPLGPDDDATIFYTSGTTGRPKGALGTHRNSISSVLAHPVSFARSCLRRGEPVPAPDPDAPQKASLVSVPFFHVTGCQAILNSAVANGAKLVLMHRWNAEMAMQLIERERCTSCGGVPTIAWQLVEHPALKKYDLSSLESISYGGAPAAGELVRRIKRAFPFAKSGTGWGMTETSSTFTHVMAEDYEHRPDSCGPPLPVCELKIVSEDGRTLPPGEVGELWAKGPNVVKEYWRKPDATAETFLKDGWLRTGDVARLDEEGFCYIVDRAKDMLIRGGENIYCVEVENVLYQHPAVVDAALVAIPHRTLGEEPGAIVTLAPGAHATEDEIRAFVAEHLAAFKVPTRVVFWPEVLPRNINGKIMKNELRKVFTGGEVGTGAW